MKFLNYRKSIELLDVNFRQRLLPKNVPKEKILL